MVWIAFVILGGIALAALFPRSSERERLAGYPPRTRLRVYLPFVPWRDGIAPSDHAELQRLHLRACLGLLLLAALPLVAAWILFEQDPSLERVPAPKRVVEDAPIAPAVTPKLDAVEVPTEPDSEPETLEELRTPTRLYGTAKVKPVYRLHDVEGALISNIQPGSFWDQVGVRNGDVVIEIHGEPLDNPAALVSLMNILARDEHVALRVRGTDGEVRYLEFRMPEDSTR